LLEPFIEQLAFVLGADVPGAVAILDNALQSGGAAGVKSPGHVPSGNRRLAGGCSDRTREIS
jgi:hypothetical protein